MDKTHPYTCNSCQLAWRDPEHQREHMKTSFHIYNLKRRGKDLPPVSNEIFNQKVLANRADAAATAAKASFERSCSSCRKTYYSQNAYEQHLKSSKHKSNVAAQVRLAARTGVDVDETASVMSSAFSLGEAARPMVQSDKDEEAEEDLKDVVDNMQDASLEDKELPVSTQVSRSQVSSQSNQPDHSHEQTNTTGLKPQPSISKAPIGEKPPINDCLFCNYPSPTFPLNVQHMNRYHSMFIPEQEYLIDAEGLVTHLYKWINGIEVEDAVDPSIEGEPNHRCLYCPKKLRTTDGIQSHMVDVGHCMINFEDEVKEVELGKYYDFSSTWDNYDSDSSASTAPGKSKRSSKKTREDGITHSGDEEDEGWETDSTVSDVPSDEITSVPISDRSHRYAQLSNSRHHSHSDPRPHRAADGFHSHAHSTPHAVYHDDYELYLPSGRTAGHRSLNRYYKQNLRHYPTAAERMAQHALTDGAEGSDEEMADADASTERGRGRDDKRQLISRANGGLGMVGVSDAHKRQARATEKRERKREQRDLNRFRAGNEKQGNFQKHFRDPLLQ